MSAPESGPGTYLPVAEPTASAKLLKRLVPSAIDLAVVLWWFAVLGLIGAVVWEMVTPLAEFTRTADNGTMDEEELGRQFGATGWYFVVAAFGGVLSGLVLLLWRRRGPVLMVLLVAVGGALAAFVMAWVGLALGPADPTAVLPTVDVGDKVPLQLEVEGFGVYFTWSVAALVGAVIALWGTESRETMKTRDEMSQFELPRNG